MRYISCIRLFVLHRKECCPGAKGHENLIVPSSELARKNGRKGGQAKARNERKRKALRDSMNMLLEMQPTAKEFNKLIEAGFEPEEIDNSLLVTIALFNSAKKGDVKAIKELRNLIGEDKPDSDAEYTKVDELIASIDRLAKS